MMYQQKFVDLNLILFDSWLAKASKRNIELSNQRLLNDDAAHRFVSDDGEIPFENYIKIDNSDLPPEKAAQIIKEKFSL